MEDLIIRHTAHPDDLEQAFRLREIVFMNEQGVSKEAEFDGLDDQCQHLIALIGDRAVGTLRIRVIDKGQAKIERVAVSRRDRGRRIGAEMMAAALDFVPDLGIHRVEIHAQTQAKQFYEKLGFAARGDIFDEDGIPHVAMHIDLLV